MTEIKRKWTPSKQEAKFEKLLKEGGFEIIAIKEYETTTKYKIAKDGLEYNDWFDFYHEKGENAEKRYKFIVKAFETYKELTELRKMVRTQKLP